MRAFVVGATGYTGRNVVHELSRMGHRVTAHGRADSSRLRSLRGSFEAAGASIDTAAFQADALARSLSAARPDAIFALLGTTRKQARREGVKGDIYEAVEGRLTRMLIDAVQSCCPDARFVFLSSMGTSSDTQNAYLRARAQIEEYLRHSGLVFTIARAPVISGADREEARWGERTIAIVGEWVLRGLSKLGAGALRERYSPLNGQQLARALVAAAFDTAWANRVLEPNDLRALASAGAGRA